MLYKTGDLARYLADGRLVLLGRRDHQVKFHGVRIELGEIEALLCKHPAVQESAVTVRVDHTGEQRLVAYIVQGAGVRGQGSGSEDKETRRQGDKEEPNVTLSPGHLVTLSDPRSLIPELRAFLQTSLPGYMLPTTFVPLDALPLTPSGKLDRRALPAPDRLHPELESTFVAARTPVEQQLTEIWGRVLGLEQVGVHNNFFDLGGDSLGSLRVAAYVRDAFQLELPVRMIFEKPTIAHLAEAIQIEQVRWSAQAGHPALDAPPEDWEEGRL